MVVATINIQVIDSSRLASGDAGLWNGDEVFRATGTDFKLLLLFSTPIQDCGFLDIASSNSMW